MTVIIIRMIRIQENQFWVSVYIVKLKGLFRQNFNLF